jgi:MoaA/NifB/PqqE/SkfB family radical SAM enzyme/GT2 family glycosyltransferase
MTTILEGGVKAVPYFTDDRHFILSELSAGAYGPNIGVDGRNLTILFLSLNRASLSIRLLRSVVDKIPCFAGEILIADNCSEPSERQALKTYLAEFPFRWRLLEFERNFGVAGGRNRSIAEVKTDWVMSLDNDIFFVDNPLPQIQRDLAVLGCHFLSVPLLNPDLKTLYAFGGHLQTVVQNDRPRLTLTTVLPPNSPVSLVAGASPEGNGFLCSFVFGGASVLNRHTFNRIGGYDDHMFIGFEDIDFSLRVFREGLKAGSASVLALVHDHPKAEEDAARSYERTRFSRDILKASARYLEAKHSFVIWGDEIEGWLTRSENLQGFMQGKDELSGKGVMKPTSRRPRIALVTDTDTWAFANISRQLTRYLGDRYEFEIIPLVQLSEIERARWLRGKCAGEFVDGGASAFGQALLLAKDFDIVHVFWREYLTLIDTPLLRSYAESLGLSYQDFRRDYIEGRVFSTSVYDHLFLEPEALSQRQGIFGEVVTGYYVASEKLRAVYEQLPGYPQPDAVLEDGVDLSLFGPEHLERFDEIGKREIVVGWVGNSKWAATTGDRKGVQSILIPAIEELRSEGVAIRLHLVDRQNGHIPHRKMPEYYSQIDLYVCTSDIEGTPNPVLESMACGVPIISTDVGIVPQAFGPLQREFILRERSIQCLKEALRRLIAAPSLFKLLSQENLQSVTAWDWRHKTARFSEYFDLLLYRKAMSEGTVRTKICTLPFTTPSMETDGSIRLCSAASIFAYRDETNMGNCRANGLESVWRGEKYQGVRKALFTGENLRPYCDACEYRFDGPAWVLQLHLGLHAHQSGVRSGAVRTLIAARKDRYGSYQALAPSLGLTALPLPAIENQHQRLSSSDQQIKPSSVPLPEDLLEGGDMPINLDLNTLNRCNVSCTMCPFAIRYDDRHEEKDKYYRLTLDEYKKITEGVRVASAHFVGAYAEPLLNKEIFSLVGYAHQRGSFTAITSNGMALVENFARRLVEAGLDMLTISLHGARRETAEAVMRGSDFDRIVRNIRGLQKMKKLAGTDKPEIYFNYVGMRSNVADLPDFVDLAADLGVRHIHFIHLIDGDEAVDSSQSLVSAPELLLRFVPQAKERADKHGLNLYVSSAYQEVMDKGRKPALGIRAVEPVAVVAR